MPLEVQPTMQEPIDAIRSLANGKAIGSDGVSVELFKITLNERRFRPATETARYCRLYVEGGVGAAAVDICHHHGTS